MTRATIRKGMTWGVPALDERGQAMVEFIVTAPVLIAFLFAIWYVSDLFYAKSETLVAARYAAWRYAKDDDTGTIEAQVKEYYFSNERDAGSRMSVSQQTPSNADTSLLENASEYLTKFISKLMTDADDIKGAQVDYQVLGGKGYVHRFLTNDSVDMLPTNVKISSTHYVCGNSWDGCHTEVHDMVSMIKEFTGFGDILDSIGF